MRVEAIEPAWFPASVARSNAPKRLAKPLQRKLPAAERREAPPRAKPNTDETGPAYLKYNAVARRATPAIIRRAPRLGALCLTRHASRPSDANAAISSPPKPTPEGEEETPADPMGDGQKSKDGKLYDKEGREYKVCPQCGYNMYKQGRMWICENCGYSYVE